MTKHEVVRELNRRLSTYEREQDMLGRDVHERLTVVAFNEQECRITLVDDSGVRHIVQVG